MNRKFHEFDREYIGGLIYIIFAYFTFCESYGGVYSQVPHFSICTAPHLLLYIYIFRVHICVEVNVIRVDTVNYMKSDLRFILLLDINVIMQNVS